MPPLERDNDAERAARIDAILRALRDVQARVERLAEEALQRARRLHPQHRKSKESE